MAGKNWFPRTLAVWQEPRRLKRARAEAALRSWSLWSRAGVVLLTVVILLPPIILRQELLTGSWPTPAQLLKPIAEVLGFGLFLVLAVPLMRFLPHHVKVTDHGIALISSGTRVLPYASIVRGHFATAIVDDIAYPTLNLELKKGRVEIGLADRPSVAELRSLLSRQGMMLDP